MDMGGSDDNGGNKKNGCNKLITLKVNPKGSEMIATDGYVETCQVFNLNSVNIRHKYISKNDIRHLKQYFMNYLIEIRQS